MFGEMTYNELKSYLASITLPNRLNTKKAVYLNLPKYVEDVMKWIDSELSNGKPTNHARHLKQELIDIHAALQDLENWNPKEYEKIKISLIAVGNENISIFAKK